MRPCSIPYTDPWFAIPDSQDMKRSNRNKTAVFGIPILLYDH